ncbi:integrase [Arthrobacter phage Liebe]|uniref:Serine integrase n=2 Tax=Arthrobacter virus Liebe TaxID=2734245 RepID=A0A3G2KHR2_9CAUD|nr:integrase [Arthrobacter phage Liebe]AYN58532.1 serine integrase [Arthrobacter phage Maureen]AZF93784.1 serine integrase [Arthrobacter phage Liebe]
MRVIGYVRLSRASREESTSVVRQRDIITRTASARDLDLVGIVEDVDVSATKSRLDRPGLDEVRARVRAGEADAVLVWRLDRIARSVVDFGTLLDDGLDIISATEPLDTASPMGRAMAEVLQVFARLEAKTIGLRVAASQEHLRKIGRWPGGVLPYGYRAVPHPEGAGRALEPDPAESAVVRRMADECLSGRPVYAIAQGLNADGIPPRRASSWSPTSVQRILRSNAVLGRVKVRGDLLRDDAGVPVQVWAPLLDVDEVERLRALTDWSPIPGRSAATAAGKRRKASRLLSGLLYCPGCGGPLVARTRRDTALYSCGASARGRACPGGVAVEADRVEAEVARRFLAAFGRLEVVEARESSAPVAGLAAVEEAIRDTTDALRDPAADVPVLVDRLTSLRAERDRLAALPSAPTVALVETGESFATAWDRLDVAGRRRMLTAAGLEVEIGRGLRGRWTPDRIQARVAGQDLPV